MQPLAERLGGFAAALLDPALAVPKGLVGPDREPSAKRFAVYRNNVVVGLTEALQANFPAACRIVGEEFFQAMARAYVALEPPVSPILLDYGAGFANFIAAFEPAATLPYLSDVARIERAWTQAYHAREAVPIGPEALADIPGNQTVNIRFAFHPSLRFVRSQFPALTIWRMNVGDGVPSPVGIESGGEDALIVRPAADVEVRSLPSGGAEFLAALISGKSLAEATKSAMKAHGNFDLAANLTALISAGAFVGHSISKGAS
jgi:hypothetical protein